MTARHRHSQRPDTDPLVALYDIDTTMYGGQVLHWTPGPLNSQSGNLVANPCCLKSMADWNAAGTNPPTARGLASTVAPEWWLQGFGSGYFRNANGLPAGGTMNVWTRIALPQGLPAGRWIEAQARLLPIRCQVNLQLFCYAAGGALLGGGNSAFVSDPGTVSRGDQADDYQRVSYQMQVPANAMSAQIYLTAKPISGSATDPYVFFSMVQLALISQPSNLPLPFMPPEIVGQVSYGGVPYTPVPIGIERVQWTGQGPIPRPQVSVPNVGGFAEGYLKAYGDLLGCKVTRRRVYKRFLDGQAEADPTDFFGPDIWYVDRVALRTPEVVVLELASPFDIQGKMLPGRQVIRDICTRTYRVWIPGQGFVLGNCPYNGPNYWKADGTPTGNPAEDDCGRRTNTDCPLRFPNQALPTWAFPGVVRARV